MCDNDQQLHPIADNSMPMSLIALAAASSFVLPQADMRMAEYFESHAPKSVEREGRWAAADVEVFVDPKGRVLECAVKRVVGDSDLAQTMCSLSVGQRMTSPRDFGGKPVHGLGRTVFGIAPDSQPNPYRKLGMPENERLEIAADQLPVDASASTQPFDLRLVINELGAVNACQPAVKVSAPVESISCQLASSLTFPRKLSKDGRPVKYVRSYLAEVVTKK